MSVSPRERLLHATFACVARYGLGKTTVEDVAREAGMSRATVYRSFPGGREQLLHDVIAWEVQRFFVRLAAEVAAAPDFRSTLELALRFAHRAIGEHEVLQKVLQTEPERLLPTLTIESQRVLGWITGFIEPLLHEVDLRPGVRPGEAAEYIARLVLSYIGSPGQWDLTDPEQVALLVRTELLAGVLADPGPEALPEGDADASSKQR